MNEQVKPEKMKTDIESVLGIGKKTTFFARNRGALITAAVIAAALLLYLFFGFGGSGNGIRYETEQATQSDITVTVTATGTVEPTNEVEVSSELSGIIRDVQVDYNSAVEKGQLLATLDTDKLKATVDSSRAKLLAAKARVTEAEASVLEAKLEYERKAQLVERKAGTPQDLEAADASYKRAIAELESAKADVSAAQADLSLDETNLEKAAIRSPVTGVVLSRDVEPGQTVASSLQAPTLFTIAEDLAKMEVQVDVDEADVGTVKEGQTATFTVDAYPNRTFQAEIRELRFGSEVVQDVVTYKAVLTTDNSDLLLRPGMTATAEIITAEVKDAVTVPNAALRYTPPAESESGDTRNFLEKLMPGMPRLRRASSSGPATGSERQIWVLENGVPKEIAITVGKTDGKRTEVVKGDIEPGQAVIVDATTNG